MLRLYEALIPRSLYAWQRGSPAFYLLSGQRNKTNLHSVLAKLTSKSPYNIMNEEVKPRPQPKHSDFIVESMIRNTALALRRTCEEAGMDLATTENVLDLGCGQGFDVSALLSVFPVAQIYVVDCYNLLPPSLISNERVRFHQGPITQVLAQKTIPAVDLILCKFMGKDHGFTYANIHLLRQTMTEDGKLMTCGDNGAMESAEWFRNSFKPVFESHEIDISVWEPRTN